MKYIFQMEDFGFFKYTLHSVTMLRSRYAYVLFMYLEKNRRMHLSWEVPVEELRYIMKADDPKTAAMELKARAQELGLC